MSLSQTVRLRASGRFCPDLFLAIDDGQRGAQASYTSAQWWLLTKALSTSTTMARWRFNLPLLLLAALQPWLALAEHSFENTAIVRTVELGGSLVHVTTTYAIKALEDGSSIYTLAVPHGEHEKTSWLEVKIKGQSAVLPFDIVGQDAKT